MHTELPHPRSGRHRLAAWHTRLAAARAALPWRSLRLVATGFAAGVAASLSLMTVAQEPARREAPPMAMDVARVAEAVELIRRNGIRELPPGELTDGCIAGMARTADPDSEFFDAPRFAELRQSGSPRAGIGLELKLGDDGPVVVAPIEGAPAARAGLRTGDRLIKIDQEVTGNLPLQAVVRKLQGEPRSSVTLTIRRSGVDGLIERTIEREFIRPRPVQVRRIEPGLAYVRLSQFTDGSVRGLADEVRRMAASGDPAPRGIVLDLRGNPGGLLDAAIGVAAAFLPRDTPILTLRGRTEESNRQFRANPADYTRFGADELARLPEWMKSAPMAVLVDAGSAAGSEIVAGALQDHRRALVVGERTFGRGSIQTIIPMSARTALKLTTSEWFTPAGTPLAQRGITPDLASRRPANAAEGDDPVLAAAVARLATP